MIFKDKTVIITGASEGVGAATARMFAEAGANLMLVARTKKNLEAVAEQLRDKSRVEIFAMDVADAEACVDLFKKTQFEFGQVDILINNAGYHARGPVEKVVAAELARMIDVNLRAPLMLTRLAIPHLREAGGGAIINVGSMSGVIPLSRVFTYSMTKAAVHNISRNLAREWATSNIRVNTLVPGFFPAEQNRKVLTPERIDQIMGHTPMKRFGEATELDGATLRSLRFDPASQPCDVVVE